MQIYVITAMVAVSLSAKLAGQTFSVGTLAPSGGQVLSPQEMHVLFPPGVLTLPAQIQLTPGLASFTTRIAPIAGGHLVGIAYDLAVGATDGPNYPLIAARTHDGSHIAAQAFTVDLHPHANLPLAGTLRFAVQTTGRAFDGTASGHHDVDLDGDRVADVVVPTPVGFGPVSRTWRREVPLLLEPGERRAMTFWSDARVTCYSPVGGASISTQTQIVFAHGPAATSVEFGSPCGAHAEGWYETESTTDNPPWARRTMQVSLRGPPSAPALLVIGTDRVQWPVPGSHCLLYTTPIVCLPVSTSPHGIVDVRAEVPDTVDGACSFQFFAAAAGELVATQGLSLLLH